MPSLVILALTILAAAISLRLFFLAAARHRSVQIVDSAVGADAFAVEEYGPGDGRLVRWLAAAGYRSESAATLFAGATIGAAALSLAIVLALIRTGTIATMAQEVTVIPGGIGDGLALVATGTPYIIFLIFTLTPTLIVRGARRSRIAAIEQDLAASLELLATLAEAGLGFDAGIARILESESGERPLAQEFRIYQRDLLGGISRQTSLKKLAARVDLTSVTIFASAVNQAEQMGSSLAETLRSQSDDLRDRRKLRALLLAQALPVKLTFPLMFCFLPGIFYSTLGPVLAQLAEVVDSVLRGH